MSRLERIPCGETAIKRYVSETAMIRSCFQKFLKHSTRSVEDEKVAHEGNANFGQELLRKNLLLTWSSFFDTFTKLH